MTAYRVGDRVEAIVLGVKCSGTVSEVRESGWIVVDVDGGNGSRFGLWSSEEARLASERELAAQVEKARGAGPVSRPVIRP